MESKRLIKKMSMILLSWCLLISMFGGLPPAYADGTARGLVTVTQAIDDAAGYIVDADGNALTDWDAYALARAGKLVPASYLSSLSNQLEQNGGLYNKVTDYARITLGVKAAGGNPEQITAGSNSYNIIQNIYNSEVLTNQGTNGAIYSLLALSSGTYNIPLTAKWNPDKIVTWLLLQKNTDGGWPLAAGGASNVDITASAINALSAYKTHTDVQQAIDGGIQWLSSKQLTNGGFSEYGENAESTAQVILALSAAGIDARSSNFTKTGGNPLSYLFGYREADGGFAHVVGGSSDVSATGQSLMALTAYNSFTGGNSGSYDAKLTQDSGTLTPANVTVHVIGPKGVIAEGPTVSSNVYDAVIQVLNQKGISYESPNYYFTKINGSPEANGTWWYYNVKRQGTWDYTKTNISGTHDYKLRNGDDIYLYNSGYDTAVVKSITLDPALPVAGQAYQVKVQQSVWDFVNQKEDVTVASSVYVEIDGQKVQTNSQGIALFPSGLPNGTFKAEVSGYREGIAPKIVTDSKTFEVGSATIQVEGSSGTYAVWTASSPNLLDSMKQHFGNFLVTVMDPTYGEYVKSIGSDADYWNYAVYHQGKWHIPQVGMASYTLQPGDRAVIYYGKYDANWNPITYLVDSIIMNPSQPKANESFTITVNKTSGYDTPSPAEGVLVKIGSLTATTDSQGTVTFAGLPEGPYTLDLSGYVTGGAPTIVHTSQAVTIQPRTGDGTGTIVNPTVNVFVIGDSNKGTILPSTSVPLRSGDTPYSILIRTLGADRVQSSGSGSTAYVQGIDGLNEFDRGPLSGWVYAVNSCYLSVGADATALKSGDTVTWTYTLNGGKELNACNSPNGAANSAVTGGVAYSEVTDAIQKLGLSYDNQKPINEIAKSAIILNADKKMTADTADTLKQELETNSVKLQKAAFPKSATVINDAQAEIQLQIPSGALKEITGLTVNELPSADRKELVSSMYEFGPSGQSFDKPIQISIKVPIAAEDLNQLALVWLNEGTGQWIPIPAVIDAETGTVSGLVNHFTKFAVINKSKVSAAASHSAEDVGPSIERASKWLKGGAELRDRKSVV
jgi:trimeric autotransporter adhesin